VPQRLIDMANAHADGLERYSFLQGLQGLQDLQAEADDGVRS
jgi:hypothetical protein